LAAALRWYVDRQANRGGFAVHFHSELPDGRLAPELETACFRVVQEAVTNVIRHAKAEHVWIKLRQDGGELRLSVRDDGEGFDMASVRQRASQGRSFGLLGMQERVQILGGHIDIHSRKGHGTNIRVSFPAPAATAASGPA
jgi:signal transduction histidine kinase